MTKHETTTGNTDPLAHMSNAAALEAILLTLPVTPTATQLAVGRALARDLDDPGQPAPATKFVAYLGWLESIENAMPPEADELDLAQ